MEEYTQITLTEWMSWKEDIRRKLAETAGNFVHIGYRLKQIRDSGMYDGSADIFEFAQKEYGLSKSTVSRFIAINEKFSEGGNSLELRKEYQNIGSSKLAEMLTLPDADCSLITERTTVKEIRELKEFNRQEIQDETEEACCDVATESPGDRVITVSETDSVIEKYREGQQESSVPKSYTSLQKCVIDFFKSEDRKQALCQVMDILAGEVTEEELKSAAAIINPGDYCTHKKGLVFLFLYDWQQGVKYKLMTVLQPVSLTWIEFLKEIQEIYQEAYEKNPGNAWEEFYGAKEKPCCDAATESPGDRVITVSETDSVTTDNVEEQISGQDSVEEHPEWLPEGYVKPSPPVENTGDWRLIGQIKAVFAELKQDMAQKDYKAALENGWKFVELLEQLKEGEKIE